MPPAVERYVAEQFREEARIMAEQVGGPAVGWLDRIEAILRDQRKDRTSK
jgi:hypothetical protein